jgi:hypothetical protein
MNRGTAFRCYPNLLDGLENALTAAGAVYHAAWAVCDELYKVPERDAYVPHKRGGWDLPSEFTDFHNTIDVQELFSEVVTPERRELACGLGHLTDPVFWYYVHFAIKDHSHAYSPCHVGDEYCQWALHKNVGLRFPFDEVAIETTEDGLDWLCFGELLPIELGLTGSISRRINTAYLKRHDFDFEGYEIKFVGEKNPGRFGGGL